MHYMVEAFKGLKGKTLSCPEKEEELTEEIISGGEAAVAEMAVGATDAIETVKTTPAVRQQATPQRAQTP